MHSLLLRAHDEAMRRSLTRAAITLIAINAALAIVILALGRMGDIEGRILGTSLLATFSALVAMVQVPAMSERRLGVVPFIGIAACGVGFAMGAAEIWVDIGSDVWGRMGGSGYVAAAASAAAAILSGWPIRGRASWVGQAANVVIAVAAVMILGGIWFEFDNEGYWRTFAVVAVLVGAAGLAIPILHRSSVETIEARIEHCPFCGTDLSAEAGKSIACEACTRKFSVLVEV